MDPLNFLDLALGPRRVLRALLAFSSKDHFFDWVFPSRMTLAAEAHLGSLPTLYRHLKTLEIKGYIIRRQLRDDLGSYSMSHVQFTDKSAALLGVKHSGVRRNGGSLSTLGTTKPENSMDPGCSEFFDGAGDSTWSMMSSANKTPFVSRDGAAVVGRTGFDDFDEACSHADMSPSLDCADLQFKSSMAVNEFISSDDEFTLNSCGDSEPACSQDTAIEVPDERSLSSEFHTFDGFPQKPRINVIGGVYKSERTRSEQLKGSAERASSSTRRAHVAAPRLRDRRRDSDVDPHTRLPRELTGLLQHLNRSTVCYLMKLCRVHGKRLGDIWAVQKDYIGRMRGSVAGFLVSEIRKDIDYAWMRSKKAQDASGPTAAAATVDRPRRLNAIAAELLLKGQGRAVTHEGKPIGVISAIDKAVVTRRGVVPVNGRFVAECVAKLYSVEGLSISLETGILFL